MDCWQPSPDLGTALTNHDKQEQNFRATPVAILID